jgi:hypothetical protein
LRSRGLWASNGPRSHATQRPHVQHKPGHGDNKRTDVTLTIWQATTRVDDTDNLSQCEIDRFLEQSVDVCELHDPWPVADRVVFTGEFFSFADDMGVVGEQAFTIAVIGDGSFIDIAAWKSDRLAVWCGLKADSGHIEA